MANFPVAEKDGDRPEVMRLTDATVVPVPRYNVGIYNQLFGGGLAHTSVNLVGGAPGAGKTTLFMILCDLVLDQTEGDGLYIACEQSREELKDVAVRLRLKNIGRILVVDAMGGLRTDLGTMLIKYAPKIVILDSLTGLIGEELTHGVEFVKAFKHFTVRQKMPSMIVNQVTKDGSHAGANQTAHAGDAIFTLAKDDVTGQRLLYSEKNRFGQAPINLPLTMMPEGSQRPGYLVLDESERDEDEDEDED
jgi:DNA repair protein RadA/Sms